jgi:hypothetical protein
MNPLGWLRLEALAELCFATWIYAHLDSSWWLFAILFLTPDLGMLGYLAGARLGAWCYNVLHNYALPIPLLAFAWKAGHPQLLAIAVIWCAHIAFDRMLGYGLKTPVSFQSTHLGTLGYKPSAAQ